MADSPDIGGYTFNEDDCISCVKSSSITNQQDHCDFASLSRFIRSSPRRPSVLPLCLLALLLPTAYSHVLPSTHRSRDASIYTARSVNHYPSMAGPDAPLLERRAVVINGAVEKIYQLNELLYAPNHLGIVSPLAKRQTTTSSGDVPACTATPKAPLPVGETIGFAIVVVILVLLSGVFAGLTLGYMSLDETQLQVLMSTGSEVQKARAAKIIPIRKDGHLLLTTLLIANMITNETLPEIFDPLLPSKVLSVVISTVLIVIFAELIPQSTCSRYGLQIGAFMAFPTRCIIIALWPVAWPVSRILHWVLGAHHGIVYRRAELKELVTMHAASGGRGGDLKRDTVMIVGGALDLQEKVVKQAMTPIDQVFMLPFTAKLDYATLEKVVRSGHSRIPIFQEIEVEAGPVKSGSTTPKKRLPLLSTFTRKVSSDDANIKAGSPRLDPKDLVSGQVQGDTEGTKTVTRKKIVGTLLVKSCVLLDPEDAVPVSSMVINALPTVPADEPLLNVLNAFQEGRSHMAIVSPRSRRGMTDIADLGSKSHLYRSSQKPTASAAPRVDGLSNIDEEKQPDLANELTRSTSDPHSSNDDSAQSSGRTRNEESPKRRHLWSRAFGRGDSEEKIEQDMPADAMVELSTWESRQSFHSQPVSETGLPLGIITLEDVLEELLGEEILDEYDDRGNEEQDFRNLMPPPSPEHGIVTAKNVSVLQKEGEAEDKQLSSVAFDLAASTTGQGQSVAQGLLPLKKTMLTRLGITRQRSQRDAPSSATTTMTEEPGSIDQGYEPFLGDAALSVSPVNAAGSAEEGYFEQAVTTHQEQRPRASSTPPANRQQADQVRGRSVSRPPSPTAPALSSATPANATQLYSPQPSRAVLIRAQTPGGVAVTTIANESLLRGRQQSLPTQTSALNPSSRSQTPAGGLSAAASNKGNRFKSQAAVGVGASPLVPARSRSQAPAATNEGVDPQDADNADEAEEEK